MLLDATLASLHLLAVLTLVVFQSSQAALCRPEWFNAAVLQRLGRLETIILAAYAAVVITGLVRLGWGSRSLTALASQPMFHLKLVLVVILGWLAWRPLPTIRQWQRDLAITGQLPRPDEIRRARAMMMTAAHLVPVIAVVAVLLARGF